MMEMEGVRARIKVTYSTINNGWRRKWKAVAGGGGGGREDDDDDDGDDARLTQYDATVTQCR